jgi:hypothetical protein
MTTHGWPPSRNKRGKKTKGKNDYARVASVAMPLRTVIEINVLSEFPQLLHAG